MLVSVLMPAYNVEKFLNESIDSILNQTFKDFDFYIINDGSTDRTEEIILSYSDPRIKYIRNEKNIGYIKSLNKGLELINSKYIVRMDSDDVSQLDRLEKQVQYMEDNNQVAVCGSSIIKFKENPSTASRITQVITDAKILAFSSIFYTSIYHPSVIIRNDLLKNNNITYQEKYYYAEDKAIWLDISEYGLLSNVDEPLLYYRIHDKQVSSQFSIIQVQNSLARTKLELVKYGANIDHFGDKTLEYICYPHRCSDLKIMYSVEEGMKELSRVLLDSNKFNEPLIYDYFRSQLRKMVAASSNLGIGLIEFIYKSQFLTLSDFNFKYYLKCILKRNTRGTV
ncbi:MAG TPA: glycosyltransferase family 2 protein [Anditalea sp.]|nr:glycosyltransferase family 2 protein [Anditalea sp.]